MPDFDYANARLRAMKSRLLARPALETLAGLSRLSELLTALTGTPYRVAVQAALIQYSDLACLADALRRDAVATAGRVRSFFRGGEAETLVGLSLRRHDVNNLKAILRGLARHAPADQILAGTLPLGELQMPDLVELARSESLGAAVDLLATWRVSLARPLLELRSVRRENPPEVSELELHLEQWHLRTALEAAVEADEVGQPLRLALQQEADDFNLMTVLRLAGVGLGPEALEAQLLRGGHLPAASLRAAAEAGSVGEAVQQLEAEAPGLGLADVLEAFEQSQRLSTFERALSRRRLARLARLVRTDPLGLGVLLGYLALKLNEIANLRLIGQGLWLEDRPDAIRAQLLHAEPG